MVKDLPLITNSECNSIYGIVGDGVVCMDTAGGKGTCNGDSGGALLSSALGNTWAVIGVTSFGVDCARPDFPGVYTRVDEYLPWIRQNM